MSATSRSTTSRKKTNRKQPSPAEAAGRAIKSYEEALKTFRKGDYAKAIPQFEAIIETFPTEREICDRSRIWLKAARYRAGNGTAQPRDPEAVYYRGVLAANDGRLDDAVSLFNNVIGSDPENDKAHYALAAVCALREDGAGAATHLSKAIAIDAANRVHALNDADFDALRGDSQFMALLGKTPEGDR